MTTRREALMTLAAGSLIGATPAFAATKAKGRKAPRGFLWGAAISGHQSEGNNVNSDCWLLENLPESVFKEPSADACDSYNRYEQDLDIAKAMGLNCYRFGIEWARIEPEPGKFSQSELDHYVRVLEACHARGLLPIVTYNHFSVPRWFAMRGGWEVKDSSDLFARFCEKTTQVLGSHIGMASTFNEANIHLLYKLLAMGVRNPRVAEKAKMIAAAAAATNSPKFSCLLFANPDKIDDNLFAAHAKGYQAIKAGPGDFPVGVTLSTQDIQAVGENSLAPKMEQIVYGHWWDAVNASDFVGIQTYTRLRLDDKNVVPVPGAENTAAGYEYYPPALGATIRFAAKKTDKPIFVTETGVATDDDTKRVKWIDETLAEVAKCIDEGIEVKSYIYWSLLDNFEWTSGYGQHFGLVDVDRMTFKRTPKPSAWHLGQRAKKGLL